MGQDKETSHACARDYDVYACMYVYTHHACMRACMRARACVCVYATNSLYACMHFVCVYVPMCARMNVCIHARMPVCVRMYM